MLMCQQLKTPTGGSTKLGPASYTIYTNLYYVLILHLIELSTKSRINNFLD